MSFIRAKEIPPHSGNWYDYLVETYHENGHVRQRVLQYLGKSGTHGSRSGGRGSLHAIPVMDSPFPIATNPPKPKWYDRAKVVL